MELKAGLVAVRGLTVTLMMDSTDCSFFAHDSEVNNVRGCTTHDTWEQLFSVTLAHLPNCSMQNSHKGQFVGLASQVAEKKIQSGDLCPICFLHVINDNMKH